jgi:hypothetical protein
MTYTANATVCSEIRTKHSTQSEHNVEFLILWLVIRKETASLLKVDKVDTIQQLGFGRKRQYFHDLFFS